MPPKLAMQQNYRFSETTPSAPTLAIAPTPNPRTFEIKYRLPLSNTHKALSWLDATMIPDAQYSEAIVHTLYFDDSLLNALNEKENSDFLKTKVRLRCYTGLNRKPQGETVFAEVKYRIGRTREKIRFDTTFSPQHLLTPDQFPHDLATINDLLATKGLPRSGHLLPAVQLEYERHRFVEPLTSARVCLDTNIFVCWANPLLFPYRRSSLYGRCKLPATVFEYKHLSSELPRTLKKLWDLGARRSSFSKYFACAQSLMGEDV